MRSWLHRIGAAAGIAALILLLATRGNSATFPVFSLADQNGSIVPVCNQSAPIAISSATTTQLVAGSGTTTIYVCGFMMTDQGTSPTVQFEYGTGSSCSSPTLLSGAMQVAGGVLPSGTNGLATVFRVPGGLTLCAVTTGTTPSVQGYITYGQY